MAKAGDVRNHRIRHSASGTNPRMGLLRVRCRTALNCWAHGFNEQIFGADEQVRGRGQPPRLRPGCSRLVPSCGLGNRQGKALGKARIAPVVHVQPVRRHERLERQVLDLGSPTCARAGSSAAKAAVVTTPSRTNGALAALPRIR